MYSLKSFGSMIRDDVRMRAYVKAMQRAIRPGHGAAGHRRLRISD